MTQLLAKRFCPEAKETLNAFPLGYAPSMKMYPYPIDWKSKYVTKVEKEEKENKEKM